ncbi:putative tricarboxylic transport membrane protein [Angulomicrobium tetraedrale]|uniref:Putative tricarboxylic transport membrane protein n=1 Tax=Ancylobacter tetraedralis TaxID=217068 RepID=A0A839Z7A2_9HYPH|nr:tripartite tricarboxylate transporter substrate-binding protein [Ancylobacter tetraedralis]MBB3770530.1 putative tricarboxylic transport membrane protein [Ancylobacter tetraedralis]
MNRRRFITGVAGVLVALPAAGPAGSVAWAQAQPSTQAQLQPSARETGPLALFVPAGGGGGGGLERLAQAIDMSLRETGLVADPVTAYHPGTAAGGLVQFVDRERGRTDLLMVCGIGMAGVAVMQHLAVSLSDLTPIACLITENLILAVSVDSPFRSLGDLLSAMRQQPDAVSFVGSSLGSTDHLLVGMLARHVGISGRLVGYHPYVGGVGAADAAVRGAAVGVVCSLGDILPEVNVGRLRALAISSSQRLPGVAVPTFAEQGVDIRLANWRGVFAPPGIGVDSQADLVGLMERMVAGQAWRARLFQYNWQSSLRTGEDFARFVREETNRVRSQISALGLI